MAKFGNATNRGIPEQQILYVGKHGDNANNGLSIDQAILTFGQAITLASAMSPDPVTNRIVVTCLDDGIYVENIVTIEAVDIWAPNANLTGSIDLNGDVRVTFRSQLVVTGTTGVTSTAGGNCDLSISEVVCEGTANWVAPVSGLVNLWWDSLFIGDGTGIYANGGACLIQGGLIFIFGTGVGISADNAGTLAGKITAIADQVTGASYGIYIRDESFVSLTVEADIQCDTAILVDNPTPAGTANVSITCGAIQAATAYNVTFGNLYLIANNILGGSRLVSGTGSVKVTVANPYGTAGQIWTSSGEGIDPVWSDFGALVPAQQQIIYVSKNGNNANSGLNIENAKLTFSNAITQAVTNGAVTANPYSIVCFDDGDYVETVTIPDGITIYAPNAQLTGSIIFNGDKVTATFATQVVATGTQGVTCPGGKPSTVYVNDVYVNGTGTWVYSDNTLITAVWHFLNITANGTGFDAPGGFIALQGQTIEIDGAGTAITASLGGVISGTVALAIQGGTGATGIIATGASDISVTLNTFLGTDIAISIATGGAFAPTLNISANEISGGIAAYDIDSGILNLICNSISGTRTATGTGVANVTIANPYGTIGQIWQSKGTGVDPDWATLSSTYLDITNTTGSIAINTKAVLKTDTGFGSWAAGGPYFSDSVLGSFTVLVAGSGFINGLPVSWTAPQTVTGLTAGNTYYIYIDNTGTLQKTPTRTDALYQDNIVLFECLRDSTSPTNIQTTVKDNHSFGFPVETSNYLHDVINTVIEDGGANIVLNGTQKIQINGNDTLNDHGLETAIPDSAGVAIVWKQYFLNASGKWALFTTSDTFTGVWNNAGTVTTSTGTQRTIYTLYASKDSLNTSTPDYYAVINGAVYGSQAAANTAITNGTNTHTSGELAQLEFVQLGTIIYQKNTNTINTVNISKTTFRSSTTTSGTNSAALVTTNISNFNNVLTAADTDVQAALDTINNLGGGVYWNVTAATTITPVVSNGYATTAATLITATLPATVTVGRVFEFLRTGAGNWHIAQNAGQSIKIGTSTSTTGVTGYLESTAIGDAIKIVCIVANTTFYVLSSVGDITVN